MTTTTLQPGRRRFGLVDTRRISKPRLSRLVLVFTGMVIALVLFVWLLLWINPTRRGIGASWLAQRGLARPWLGPQATDIERITGAVKGTVTESVYETFPDVLRDYLIKAGNRPVVLYISAAGVVDDQGAVLLRDDAGVIGEATEPGSQPSAIPLEKFFAVFRDAGERFPAQSRFLIWDAGQVGSDRNLGVYANGFLPKLRSFLAENPVKRLVILGSCAPGQTSAVSEVDDRSVFGYFVEQALSGKAISPNGLTVQSLSRYVRGQVALWVRNHRQAEQTPELYGDVTLNFPLPRSRNRAPSRRDEAADVEETKRVLKRLERAWAERDVWQKRKPYRSAPRTWMRYQETLLRAERLYRGGNLADAEQALNSLPNLAGEVGRVPALEGSLALLERRVGGSADEAGLAELQTARTTINEALDRLLGGEEEAAPEEENQDAGDPTKPLIPKPEDQKKQAAKPGDAPPAKKQPEAPNKAVVPQKKAMPSGHTRLKFAARRKADSPVARLFDPDDDRRPLFPEAQLAVWADTFVSHGPDRNAFRGKRGEALEKAMQTRDLAEVAAASDERINRWIRPWVEAGDDFRRKGQDHLFAAESFLSQALENLDQADETYQIAINNAEICEQAIELIEQLSAELPYYGEWKAKRAGRLEIGLDQPFQDLLDSTAELARLIHSVPPPLRTEGDPLAGRDEQIQRIKRQQSVVSEAFRGLIDDFHNQWEGGRWRDLDAVLNVPLIPAETRMKILGRVGSRGVASGLGAASEDSSTSPDVTSSRFKKESDAFLADRAARTTNADQITSEDESPSDPNFWRTASGLARLELGLLEIGGAKKEEIASLRETYERACRKLGGSPFSEFAEFSERIRSLRRARLVVIAAKPSSETLYDDLNASDRATRVLPLADSMGRDQGVEARIKFLRRDLAIWQSERLLADFAPRQAVVLLDQAGDDYGDSEELRKTAEKAKLMTRAKLLVEANAPQEPNLDDEEGMTVSIKVGTEGEIPQGDAVAFLSHELSAPVSVSEKNENAELTSAHETGVLVPIGTSNPAEPVEFLVERTDSTPETVTITLEPGAFYRGQIFPRDLDASGIVFRLTPSKEGIDVTLRQSDRKLIKLFGDQFERHPGKGFLHPHTPLAYRFVINHTLKKAAKVWVRYGLEGKDETFVTKKDVKLEPGRPNEEIADRVDTDLHEIPIDKARYLVLEIRKDNETGRVLFKRRYPFRQVLPSQYMRVQDGFDPVQNMAYVNVWHLKSDPVNGPSDVTVNLDGQSLSTVLDRGGAEQWWRIYPKPPPPVFWRIQVEKVIDAFKGRIDTGVVPPEAEKKEPAL